MQTLFTARATRLRLMAEEVRTAADAMTHYESRRALTGIADNYDLLADQLDQIAAREGAKAESR
ncbi:MAG TPA: hypothetical protein VL966_08985 [Alphaproteobacteria bacterium]|jgi:hypothetical protein|nr:hypothetical protein [Alphaproteobacteria bacterium]